MKTKGKRKESEEVIVFQSKAVFVLGFFVLFCFVLFFCFFFPFFTSFSPFPSPSFLIRKSLFVSLYTHLPPPISLPCPSLLFFLIPFFHQIDLKSRGKKRKKKKKEKEKKWPRSLDFTLFSSSFFLLSPFFSSQFPGITPSQPLSKIKQKSLFSIPRNPNPKKDRMNSTLI